VNPKNGKEFYPPEGNSWGRPEANVKALIADNQIWFGPSGMSAPSLKRFLSEVKDGITPQTIWEREDVGDTQEGKKLIKKYFGNVSIFETPKPPRLIQRALTVANVQAGDIVLDFFAGSASTIEATWLYGKPVKVILVQVPEPCAEESEPFKAGFKSIAEISKERIRRAGKSIIEANDGSLDLDPKRLDIGFRVLKIDSSNMKEVFYTPDTVSQDLLSDQVNNIREDRTAEDLLFQVLLDWGVDLALPIAKEAIAGKTVYFVDGNALAACFDEGVSEDFVKLLAKREPLRAVFRDAGFATDSVKINVEQIFKLMSPSTEVKTI